MRFPRPRPASIRRRSAIFIREPSPRTSSSRCIRTTTLHARPGSSRWLAAALPEISSDFRDIHVPAPARHLLSGRSCVQGRQARAGRPGLRVFAQALFRPALEEPDRAGLEEYKILGLNELRQRALKDKTPFDYDVEVEGLRALDRYTLQIRAGRDQTRTLSKRLRAPIFRRCGARSRRDVRRSDHGAPGRHRAVQARGLAALLSHRAGAQSELSRGDLRSEGAAARSRVTAAAAR